ncbi:MAG: hypothetical protein RLZZ200_2077 [Pseudomonadota bacterium]
MMNGTDTKSEGLIQSTRFHPDKPSTDMSSKTRLASLLGAVLVLAAAPLPAATASRGGCQPQGELQFLCGPAGSEDVVSVPGTSLLITSGLGLGRPGHVYLVDRKDRRFSPLFGDGAGETAPDAAGQDCPGAPGADTTSFGGLGLRRERDGHFTLYAANDLRNAVEIFRFDARTRRLKWTGCVLMPPGTTPNGVTALPDGGFLATSFRDHSDPSAWQRMARGEPSGGVYAWRPGRNPEPVPGLERLSGPNGVEVSRDGQELYVSVWATRTLLVVTRKTGHVRALALDFMPDNIHRDTDGTLLVAGQRTTVEAISSCGRDCPQPWVIARVDPARGTSRSVAEGPGSAEVNYACGAVSIDGTIFATVRGDDRLVIAREKPRRSRE